MHWVVRDQRSVFGTELRQKAQPWHHTMTRARWDFTCDVVSHPVFSLESTQAFRHYISILIFFGFLVRLFHVVFSRHQPTKPKLQTTKRRCLVFPPNRCSLSPTRWSCQDGLRLFLRHRHGGVTRLDALAQPSWAFSTFIVCTQRWRTSPKMLRLWISSHWKASRGCSVKVTCMGYRLHGTTTWPVISLPACSSRKTLPNVESVGSWWHQCCSSQWCSCQRDLSCTRFLRLSCAGKCQNRQRNDQRRGNQISWDQQPADIWMSNNVLAECVCFNLCPIDWYHMLAHWSILGGLSQFVLLLPSASRLVKLHCALCYLCLLVVLRV